MLFCMHGIAQQMASSKVAEITLPKEAIKRNKEQTLDFVQKHFKHKKMLKNYSNTYTVDNIVITITDGGKSPEDKLSLDLVKKMREDLDKKYGGEILESKIIKVNNVPFFVFKDQEKDEERNLSFTSDLKIIWW